MTDKDVGAHGAPAVSRGGRTAAGILACLAIALAIQFIALAGPASAETSRCPPYPCYKTARGILDWTPAQVRPYDVAGVPLAETAPMSEPGMLVGLDNGAWSYWDEGDLNAQGSDARGDIYHLSQWPYVERLYYYSHNLLSVPPTVWTNAAHRQGVKVLATLTGDCNDLACEKRFNWLFAHRPDAAVDQFHRIAAAYGFDGWMIDIEQDDSLTPNLLDAMSELSKRRLPSGRRVEVAFYNAFQTKIDDRIYGALKAAGHWQSDYSGKGVGTVTDPKESYEFLEAKGETELADDAYWSTYVYDHETEAPTDCDGHTSAKFLWNGTACLNLSTLFANQGSALAPTDPPGRYLAPSLFAPAWTMFGGLSKTTDKLPSRASFERNDAALWQGPGFVDRKGRCAPADKSANAVSSMVKVRPAIAGVPFVTRFGSGEGSSFWAQGTAVREDSWNLLSAQDPLPVAWCGEGGSLEAELDYGTAFDGGSSLHVIGRATDRSRRVYLYKARAELPRHTGLLLRYEAGRGPAPHAVVSLDGVDGPVDLRTHRTTRNHGWVLARARLPERFAPATVTRIGVGFGDDGDRGKTVDASIGELRVVDRDRLSRPAMIDPARTGDDLAWDAPPGSTLYYNVWAAHPSRPCLLFVGRTQLERYDLANPLFGPAPAGGGYEVQPVNAAGGTAKLSGPRCRDIR